MLKNTREKYGFTAKLLHWSIAVTIVGLFGVGLWMLELDYYSPWYTKASFYHKSVGIILAFLMVARLIWRIVNLTPHPPTPHPNWQIILARVVHGLLYTLIFLMIISGYLISTADERPIEVFGWFSVPSFGSFIDNQEDIAGTIHEWLAYVLIALASVHALAALKHHFIDKDNTLKRML